ncbi:hypothetical protein LDX65_05525 [Acinetobacter baumannii]|uniref:hypothetical protein n=1 Tax=Acinetobacter baumannii TaxID=470 RepID=UPI000447BDC8|nr:hypothetical protein [Acinetobacter baumannii]EXH48588.1 hypothetical protein J605_2332 [Acinetobacter baumannii 1412924]MCA4302728.1 hypothetical protein [Acinetobacter baumannii]
MTLPLFNAFKTPYEIWNKRQLTPEEISSQKYSILEMVDGVKGEVEKTISCAYEAAVHIAEKGLDIGLKRFIEDALQESEIFKIWRNQMPATIPKNIEKYQQTYPNCDMNKVNEEINSHGRFMSEGQYVFHGGYLFDNGILGFKTSKPLSTTLCPEVALREAEFRGKAYHQGEIHLYILYIKNPRTNAYVFNPKGRKLGHEKEILFGANANLNLISKTLVSEKYFVGLDAINNKEIPIYVIEASIS